MTYCYLNEDWIEFLIWEKACNVLLIHKDEKDDIYSKFQFI